MIRTSVCLVSGQRKGHQLTRVAGLLGKTSCTRIGTYVSICLRLRTNSCRIHVKGESAFEGVSVSR